MNKLKAILKIVVVVAFLMAAYAVTTVTPYYIEKEHYEEDEIRLIIDDKEVTKSLPNKILIENDNPLLSIETVRKYFDEYAYYDQKYDTVIIAKDIFIYKMPVNSNIITINNEEKEIITPVRLIASVNESGESIETVYIPISELSELYDINVKYNEKVIITTDVAKYYTVVTEKRIHTKQSQRELSLTTERVSKGEKLEIFDESFETKNKDEYVWVRTENGGLGYVKKSNMSEAEIITKPKAIIVQEESKKKISLTWEYAANYTPDRSSEKKIDSLDIVSPTWVYVKNASGDLKENVNKEYISWAEGVGYEVWPTIKNDDIGIDKTSELVTDMYARENFINNIIDLCKKYDFKGINLDFEYMYKKDRNEYSQLVRELSAALRLNKITSSVDVNVPDGSENWSLCFDSKPISDAVDYIIVMAYDQYGFSSDIAGPVASLEWVETNIKKMTERDGIDNKKLVLGVPFYSRYWKVKDGEIISKSTPYMNAVKGYMTSNPNSTMWSEKDGQYIVKYNSGNSEVIVYVEDEKSLEKKIELINKYNLAGIASWRRGFETEEVWDVIEENLER